MDEPARRCVLVSMKLVPKNLRPYNSDTVGIVKEIREPWQRPTKNEPTYNDPPNFPVANHKNIAIIGNFDTPIHVGLGTPNLLQIYIHYNVTFRTKFILLDLASIFKYYAFLFNSFLLHMLWSNIRRIFIMVFVCPSSLVILHNFEFANERILVFLLIYIGSYHIYWGQHKTSPTMLFTLEKCKQESCVIRNQMPHGIL